MLDVLIQLIKTHICKQLARQVADRHPDFKKSLTWRYVVNIKPRRQSEGSVVAVDDLIHQPEQVILSLEVSPEDPEQDIMVHSVKIL